MKICFVTNNIAEIGGRQRINTVVCNGLAEKEEMEISILFTSEREIAYKHMYSLDKKINILWDKELVRGKYSDLNYKILRFINKKVYNSSSFDYLKKVYFPEFEIKSYENFFKKNKFDVVVGVGTRPAAIISLLKIDSKKIAWLHCSYDIYFRKKGYFQWRQEILYQRLLEQLDDIIVLTDKDVNIYQKELKKKPIRIYNPLSFKCDKKSALLGNKLLFVGRLDFELKGLDLLVESMKKIKMAVPDFELTVVGEGKGKKRFLEEIEKYQLSSHVIFIGQTTDVITYYQNASVVVLPSRQESFGLVVTEAMECGVPVVAYETDGPSEIIKNGENGFLIEKYNTDIFADKIIELCLNEQLRYSMAKKAIQRAQDFSLDKILEKWKQIFESGMKY